MLEFKDFRYDKKRVKKLYKEAFPIDEQVPYFALKYFAKEKVNFNAIYHKGQFIGFVYNILYKDIVFLFYFAVKEDIRHQGYGSQILKIMKEKYQGYRILLNIEDIDENSSNYLERLQRQTFYLKNGFSSSAPDNSYSSSAPKCHQLPINGSFFYFNNSILFINIDYDCQTYILFCIIILRYIKGIGTMGLFGFGKNNKRKKEWNKAIELYNVKDYSKAYDMFKQLTKAGIVEARYYCGLICEQQTPPDLYNAVSWYLSAINNGYENAKDAYERTLKELETTDPFLAGNIYSMQKDNTHAFPLFLKAASQDHAQAQYQCAVMYKYGRGTSKDINKAIEWYEKSAALGYHHA